MADANERDLFLDKIPEEDFDGDYGAPNFRDHFADSLTPVVLKEWTAKDFSSVYVRFVPHLEQHAKRFLASPLEVEEVVQDAFLYLMTSLPELDSELGVLKFLKWKVRLLALDVIRAKARSIETTNAAPQELADDSPSVDVRLERADDAAIVALALSKLNPRHREAIVATVYEEKSHETVAIQMGISENAFRQLLFRAKAAFRRSLVGEASVKGKSIPEILLLASKRASANATKLGALLSVFALAVTAAFFLSSPQSDPPLAQGVGSAEVRETPTSRLGERLDSGRGIISDPEISVEEELSEQSAEGDPTGGFTLDDKIGEVSDGWGHTSEGQVSEQSQAASDGTRVDDKHRFEQFIANNNGVGQGAVLASESVISQDSLGGTLTHVGFVDDNFEIYLGLDISSSEVVQYVNVIQTDSLSGANFAFVPSSIYSQKTQFGEENRYEIWASGFVAADLSGQFANVVSRETTIEDSVFLGVLTLDLDTQTLKSSFEMLPRQDFLLRQKNELKSDS